MDIPGMDIPAPCGDIAGQPDTPRRRTCPSTRFRPEGTLGRTARLTFAGELPG